MPSSDPLWTQAATGCLGRVEDAWQSVLRHERDSGHITKQHLKKVASAIKDLSSVMRVDQPIDCFDDEDREDFNTALEMLRDRDIQGSGRECEALMDRDLNRDLLVRACCLRAHLWALELEQWLQDVPHFDPGTQKMAKMAVHCLRWAYKGRAVADRLERGEAAPSFAAEPREVRAEPAEDETPAEGFGTCSSCRQIMTRNPKVHKKKDCPMRKVKCPHCNFQCAAQNLEAHERDDCENVEEKCDCCQEMVRRGDKGAHLQTFCKEARVACENMSCTWTGLRRHAREHAARCPYTLHVCTHCLEEMKQMDVASHQCTPVCENETCSVCMETFRKKPPSILMKGSRRACNCSCQVCMSCAANWQKKENQETGNPTCPGCRAEFDGITALPATLLVRSPDQAPLRPPLPSRKEMLPGTFWFVSPLDIGFMHDSISECFNPYRKAEEGGRQVDDKEELKILTSARELLEKGEEPRALEVLDVTWYRDRLYVAGTFNRRLCMYRLLAIFAAERFGLIKVHMVSADEMRLKLKERFTTTCEGRWVEIRPGGRVGQTRDEVRWPEAVALLGRGDLDADWQDRHYDGIPLRYIVEAFAKESHMDAKQVMSVLRRLNEDQVLLVCWRFRFDFQREDPLVKLRSFVYSCQKNGFWETKKIDFKEKPSFCALLARAARLAEVADREGALHKQPPPPPPPPGAAAASSSSSDWRPSVGRTSPPSEPPWSGWQAPEESLPKKMPPPVPPPPVKETSRSSSHAGEEALPKKVPPPTPPPPVKEKAPPLSQAPAPPPKSELTPKAPPPGWLPTGAAGPGELPKKAPPQPPPAPKPCLDEKEAFFAPPPPPAKPSPAESKASSHPEPDAASSEPTASTAAAPEDGLKVGMNVRIAEGKIKGQGVVVNLCGTKAKVKRRSGGVVQEVNRSSLRPLKASGEPPGEEQTPEEAKAGSKKLREIRGPAAGAAGELQRAIAEAPAFRDLATCKPKMKEPAQAVPKESATPSRPAQGSAAAPPKPAPSADEIPEPLKQRLAEAEAREKALLQRIALLEKDNMEMAARESAFREVEVELRKRESSLSARVDGLLAEQEDLEATLAEMRSREAHAAARLDALTREQNVEKQALLARVKDAEERLLQECARHREVEDELGKRVDWATEQLHAWQSEGTSPSGVRKGRWGRDPKEEDHVHSSPDSAAASTKTGNSLPAEVSSMDWVEDGLKRLKKRIKDLLYEEVRCFAEKWDMPIDQVIEVFERLTTEQQKLVMRRFKASPHKGHKIVLLKSYVGSCLHYGFTKQTWDDIKDFSQKWGIPSSEAQDILGDLEDEHLTIITQRFHYDERTANQSTVSAQLRTYVSSCRHRGFWAADKKVHCCKKISESWHLPLDTVRELLEPLHLDQCDQIASDWRTDPRTEQDGWGERDWRSGWHDWRE